MSKSAVDHMEVRWRVTGTQAWSAPRSYPPAAEVAVDGLERGKQYDFEARNVSACGAMSVWVPSNYTVPPAPAGTLRLDDLNAATVNAQATANAASSSAAAANTELANIASDNILSANEKPVVIRDNSVIITEHAGIDAQATAYGIVTEKTAYDDAYSALSAYLAGLTTPTAWNDVGGDTTIDGTIFHGKFADVYTTRQALLDAIYAAAKALADGAQSTADTATDTANTALTGVNSNAPLILNPYFSTGNLTGWSQDKGTCYFESGANGPASGSTSYCVRAGSAANPNEALRNQARIPVYPGAVVKAQCAIRGLGGPNGTAGVRISWRDASDTEISNVTGNTTTGNATNGTYVTGIAPAGVMFAHVECGFYNHTVGYYSVDNFWAAPLADSMDQVPDGAMRFGAAEAGADKTSGKPLSTLSGRTMDYIGDSATRFAAAQAGADKTSSNPQPSTWLGDSVSLARGGDSITRFGGRTLDNVGDSASRFAAAEAGADKTAGKSLTVLADRNLDNIGDSATYLRTIQQSQAEIVDNANFEASASVPVPGWNGNLATLQYITGYQYEGSQSLSAYATAQYQNVVSTRRYKCTPGEVYEVDAAVLAGSDPWAFGFALSNGSLPAVAFTSGWSRQTVRITIPAGVTSFQIILFKSGTSVPDSAGLDDVHLKRIRVLDDDVMDGTTYGRTANADLVSSGGVNRLGLRVSGSGQTIGDQRNLQPITWASQRSVLSTSPISFSISGTTVAFSVAAFTLQGGGIFLNYAAASGSVTQAAGSTTTWFLYYLDPTQSGGSLALHITTNPGGAASFADSVFLGTATVTIASGGGGSSGTGGGGGGYCVADDMYIGEGRRAGDTEIGDPFDCIDLPTQAGKHVRALQGVTRGVEECVRMITDNGCALICSISTPFDLPNGRVTTALHMLGEQVITDLDTAVVSSLALVGPRPVTRAHLGGVSYAAGADPARRIYSHNASVSKP